MTAILCLVLTLFPLLSVYGSGVLRDRLSFPTRRSSDLTFASDERAAVVVIGYDLWTRELGRDPSVAGRAIQVGGQALDRKSTRLNSSHLGISYAVFCLKKKKQIHVSW